MKKISKPFLLIDTFASVWSEFYGGEYYEKSPRDFKQAKLYLELNEDFSPDNIINKAKIYLKKTGYFAENRHNFTAFINNIGSFVDEMPKQKVKPKLYTCKDCNQSMPESQQYGHWQSCPNYKPPSEETIKEVQSAITNLTQKWKA
jgi:hypothetical protein